MIIINTTRTKVATTLVNRAKRRDKMCGPDFSTYPFAEDPPDQTPEEIAKLFEESSAEEPTEDGIDWTSEEENEGWSPYPDFRWVFYD